jgi:hypothetical protein
MESEDVGWKPGASLRRPAPNCNIREEEEKYLSCNYNEHQKAMLKI